jgi:glycosyltransferase involved in cell wall biosynthesis
MPKVSVIIPAYNQGHYLGEAIQSVLDQTFSDFEAIIVDDGSTDNTRKVAQAITDSRFHYIFQENRGLSGARNTGIKNSQGPYLTFLDSDDLFLPEKLTLLVNELENKPEFGFVAGQAIPIDEYGRRIGKIFKTPLPEDGCQLLLGNPLHVGSVLLRRSWQERVGYFDEGLRSYEDWDMWLRLAREGCNMGWVPHPVSLYRFHTAQMTRNGIRMTKSTFAVLSKVYNDTTLPESWRGMKDLAYSNAYLRAAAQAYHAHDYDQAKTSMVEAIRLNPDLLANKGELLAKRLSAIADSPKSGDPLSYLENVYSHLPDQLAVLWYRRRLDLGRMAMQMAFDSYQRGDVVTTRRCVWQAFRHDPAWLINRGALSIFVRSWLGPRSKIRGDTQDYG